MKAGMLSVFSDADSIAFSFFNKYVAVLNFPNHRGTASALPLSAFGLSAFFFSLLSSTLFPGDTASFLLLLSVSTSSIVFISFFFLRVYPVPNAYTAVNQTRSTQDHSNKLHRTKSGETRQRPHIEPGMNYTTIAGASSRVGAQVNGEPVTETSSILSSSSSDDNNEDEDAESCRVGGAHHGHHVDIRGWALTRSVDFWLLWTLLGLMTGVGLMTIK